MFTIRRSLHQPQYSDATEAAITRALEVVSSFPVANLSIYANPVDANWLGTGLGIIAERGWAIEISPGVFNLTQGGSKALMDRLAKGAPRVRDGCVPTMTGPGVANFVNVGS